MKSIVVKFLLCLICVSAASTIGTGTVTDSPTNLLPPPKPQQLNISILLDLSDRIDPKISPNTPSHTERDIAAITAIAEAFKTNMEKKKVFDLKDRMQVFFHPQPSDGRMNSIVSDLSIELEGDKDKQKVKEIYDGLPRSFNKNLTELYKLAIAEKIYEGADIWRFMKDDVRDKCIINSPEYRNILVILTDGYMYWPHGKQQKENRYNYIEKLTPQLKKFRKNPNWEQQFEQGNYGFIPVQKNLSNLEVLVLEVAPPKEYPEDYDILRKYWNKWFDEMGIKPDKRRIMKTDLPVNTSRAVKSFIGV